MLKRKDKQTTNAYRTQYEWRHLWNENKDTEQNILIDGTSFQFCHHLCKLSLLCYFFTFLLLSFKI